MNGRSSNDDAIPPSTDGSCDPGAVHRSDQSDASGTASRVSGTSTSLLDRAQTGDADSWRRLTKLYGSLVYNWGRRQGLSAEDAADIVQEVFRTVAKHLSRFHRDRPGDSFRKWLKTITNNQVRDHWRRENLRPHAQGGTTALMRLAQQPEKSPSPEDSSWGENNAGENNASDEEAETRHLLRQALELVQADFESATWQAFWQTVVENRAAADVAADLNMTANAVRIAKSRVRSRLRQEFGKLLD